MLGMQFCEQHCALLEQAMPDGKQAPPSKVGGPESMQQAGEY